MNKLMNYIKKYWKAGIQALGSLGLGLGIFYFLRRYISIEKLPPSKTMALTLEAKQEKIYEHVRVLHFYDLMEDTNHKLDKLDHEQYLNTMFLKSRNFIILTSRFIRRFYEECLNEEKITREMLDGWSDQEVINLIPPIYCEDADIVKITFPDNTILYRVDYNKPFKIIEGDELENDIYE